MQSPELKTKSMMQRTTWRHGKKRKRNLSRRWTRIMASLRFRDCRATVEHSTFRPRPGGQQTTVLPANEHYSSAMCSRCFHLKTGLGASRVFHCPSCGHIAPRDWDSTYAILGLSTSCVCICAWWCALSALLCRKLVSDAWVCLCRSTRATKPLRHAPIARQRRRQQPPSFDPPCPSQRCWRRHKPRRCVNRRCACRWCVRVSW